MKAAFLILCLIAYVSAAKFVCQQGVSYVENECNTCICGADGHLGCTFKGCFDKAHSDLQTCTNYDEQWEKDCNKCWCSEGLGTVCTNNKC
ncbi:serine protease inhibitor I/II-like [Photinus pyralis]|nr:serine protease inhibitor I/II-like [Photinus pyralis]